MSAIFKTLHSLDAIEGIQHGFFTRQGGVSSGIYTSLNCAKSSQDDVQNVMENRHRAMAALGLENARLYGLHQIHSTIVHQITAETGSDYPDGDAYVTKEKGVAISVLGADCTPILFADKSANVIGAAHAGWRGAVSGIVKAVVDKMCQSGAHKDDIIAAIGPTIHQDSYEVQEDFIRELNNLSAIPSAPFLKEQNGRTFFDLPGYLLQQCKLSGIQAESLGLDTYKREEFFSFRRNTHAGIKDYGRQISLICRV